MKRIYFRETRILVEIYRKRGESIAVPMLSTLEWRDACPLQLVYIHKCTVTYKVLGDLQSIRIRPDKQNTEVGVNDDSILQSS